MIDYHTLDSSIPNEADIRQFKYFCTLFDELSKALVAKKGKITAEDVAYMWKQAGKQLEK